MKLATLDMVNYLSVQDATLEFDTNCLILVGKNESGKTNILQALSYLKPDRQPIASEIRENLPTEVDTGDSYLRFIFNLTEEEKNIFAKKFSANFQTLDPAQTLAEFKKNNSSSEITTMSLSNANLLHDQIIYKVDFKKLTKSFAIWQRKGNIAKGWFEKLPGCPADYSILNGDAQVIVGNSQFVHESLGTLPANYFKPATIDALVSLMASTVTQEFAKLLPTVIKWEYESNLLLPNEINLQNFAANPDSCPPLKNMFLLVSGDDIGKRITHAQTRGGQSLKNLFKSVARITSDHLSSVWTDYSGVKIKLDLNGPNIEPTISEENEFNILQRSEGFKRFICFLLHISVRVESSQLQNNLLIIDEPENGLHPSSAKDLRDELLRISQSNLVVFATHSIFMVDSKNIDRHRIIKKENEITSILPAKDNEFAEEEMIFRALGHSVFASLSEKNLIFEGWNDKKLFQVYTENSGLSVTDEILKAGRCNANGVNSLQMMSPIFELTNRKMIIISDSDEAAIRERRKFTQNKMNGQWFIYQDIDPTIDCVTGEDFLTSEYVCLKFNIQLKKLNIPELEATSLPDFDKLKYLETILTSGGLAREDAKKEIVTLKERLFEKLKYKNIDPKYGKLVNGIRSIL